MLWGDFMANFISVTYSIANPIFLLLMFILGTKYISGYKDDVMKAKDDLNSVMTSISEKNVYDYLECSGVRKDYFTINFDEKLSITEQVKLLHEIVTKAELEVLELMKKTKIDSMDLILVDKNEKFIICYIQSNYIIMECADFDELVKYRSIILGFFKDI